MSPLFHVLKTNPKRTTTQVHRFPSNNKYKISTMNKVEKSFLDETITAHIVVRIKSDEGRTIHSHLEILLTLLMLFENHY